MSDAPYPWQSEVWATLTRSLGEGRLGHAVLIAGTAGLGKRALAEALAARALCQAGSACGDCPPCHWFAAGNHPDWHVLEPEEDKTSIPVDGVRALSAALELASLAGGRKVALIEPADAMTIAAANSLLKTLEEPPGDCLLILLASAPSRLPATILSRCQMHTLSAPAQTDGRAWLEDEAPGRTWDGLLRLAGGAPLGAMALAEEGFGEHLDVLEADFAALLAGSADPSTVAGRWQRMGPVWCLSWLRRLVDDVIRLRFSVAEGDLAHRFGTRGLPPPLDKIKLNRLFEYQDAVRQAQRRLDGPVQPGLIIETLLIPLAAGLADTTFEAPNR